MTIPDREKLQELKEKGVRAKIKNFDFTPTTDEIKESIDLISRNLNSYKAKGYAQ